MDQFGLIENANPIFSELKVGSHIIKTLDNFDDVYCFIEPIGKGVEGKTNLYSCSQGEVAIKESLLGINDAAKLESQIQEAKILAFLSEKGTVSGIPQFIDSFVHIRDGKPFYSLVMKCIKGVTLFSILDTIDNEMFYKLALWLTRTVAKLHELDIIHRDIKPDNILVAEKEFYLIDFGFSYCPTISKTNKNAGTPYYMAPECWCQPATFDRIYGLDNKSVLKAIDVWATGITLFELLEKRIPWRATTHRDLQFELNQFQNNLRFNCTDHELTKVIKRMTTKDPENRLTAFQAHNSLKILYIEQYK